MEQKRWNKNGGTKTAEQKLFIIPSHPNKNWWDSASAKRSAEQKLVSGTKKKVSGTKIGEQNKNSRTKIGGRNKKRSAEQKLVSRTKIGGRNKKKVSGTNIGEHCQRNKKYLSSNVVNGI